MMMDSDIRSRVTVSPENKFLFPNTDGSINSLNGSAEFSTTCKNAEVDTKMTAYDFRHYIVTEFYALNKSTEEKKWLAIHYGHSEAMQRSHYSGLGSKTMVLTLADELNGIRDNLIKQGEDGNLNDENESQTLGKN